MLLNLAARDLIIKLLDITSIGISSGLELLLLGLIAATGCCRILRRIVLMHGPACRVGEPPRKDLFTLARTNTER